MIPRSDAERELNRLLKRALRSVPFVRLDKVEEVTDRFKHACTLLEQNLEDDFDLNEEEDDGADETVSNIPRSVPTDATKAPSDSEEEEEDEELREEKERQEKEQKELEDKEREARIRPKPGEAVRKDFSSPDIRSRGLKVPAAATTTTEEPLRKGVGASSRAGLSSRARTAPPEATNPGLGLKGASSRAKENNDLRKQLIKSKKPPSGDVPASKDRFTKDEGTPRLGGRSLLMKAAAEGARSKSTSDLFSRGEEDNSAVLARDATIEPSSDGSGFPTKKPSSRAALGLGQLPTGLETTTSYREDDNNEDNPSSTTIHGKSALKTLPTDLLGTRGAATAPTTNPLIDRIQEQALETPHSPLQLNAHRTLLKIASKNNPGGGSSDAETSVIQQKVETPKPAFLRRLDSPKTNHGILIGHKTRLNKMLRRARRGVPHMKMDQYEQIRQAFIQAVELLEQSTTMALAQKQNIPPVDPSASKILLT